MRLIDADALKEYVKIFNIGCGCDDDHHERFLDAIDDAPTIEQPHWISCSERLPEKYIGQWLCCTSDGNVMILPYDTPGDGTKECVFYKWDDDGYFYQIFDVIAWAPLPEPYT